MTKKKYNTNNSSATISCESLLAPTNLERDTTTCQGHPATILTQRVLSFFETATEGNRTQTVHTKNCQQTKWHFQLDCEARGP